MAKRRRRSSSSPSKKRRKNTEAKTNAMAPLCFQDVWKEYLQSASQTPDEEANSNIANVFFELANAPSVSYRLEPSQPSKDDVLSENDRASTILIQQDVSGAAQTHTGGIVWETSYLLLNYLLSDQGWLRNVSFDSTERGKGNTASILEIGAGCGMLGLSLHRAFEMGILGTKRHPSRVILTETDEVVENLKHNLEQNCPHHEHESKRHDVEVQELDWTRYKSDCSKASIEAHSIDCIVGTDVVFSTRFVIPMLETMQFLSHSNTLIYLCLQERCKDSHKLLLEKASEFGFQIDDISESVYDDEALTSSCSFGRALECKLLKVTVLATRKGRKSQKAKKERKSKK